MICSECGAELPAMKTVYWPSEGEEAEEWQLCEGCYAEVTGKVLIVPGPYYAWGWCNDCQGWCSLNDMHKWTGGGRTAPWRHVRGVRPPW